MLFTLKRIVQIIVWKKENVITVHFLCLLIVKLLYENFFTYSLYIVYVNMSTLSICMDGCILKDVPSD